MRRLAPLCVLLAACGSPTDSGSGSGTLFATIEVSGEPNSTKIEVELLARGNPVIGANVAFEDHDTEQTFVAEQKSAGSYRTTLEGYVRTLKVKITSGEDDLEATLEGPAPHVITRPQNNAIVARRDFDTLLVEWEADDAADRVEIDVKDGEKLELSDDPFSAELPLGGLRNGEQKVEVLRETNVDLDGGAEGSRMRSRYVVDNRFTLEG